MLRILAPGAHFATSPIRLASVSKTTKKSGFLSPPSSHDGFTLHDLVSFEAKHNEANGEGNRDGDNNNISWNSGAEGTSTEAGVLAMRERRIRSFAVILLLSNGVPMLVAGDELGRSQGGNNNAWNQDNETSWLDWRLVQKNSALLHFFRRAEIGRASCRERV